mgnify:CR=1 FL=1
MSRFGDDVAESNNEEVSKTYFTSKHIPGECNPRITGRQIRGRKLVDRESALRNRGTIRQYGKQI